MHIDNPVVPERGYPAAPFCSSDRLPEKHPSMGCDMRSYMVIFGELVDLGFPPFPRHFPGGILTGIVYVYAFGPLPKESVRLRRRGA